MSQLALELPSTAPVVTRHTGGWYTVRLDGTEYQMDPRGTTWRLGPMKGRPELEAYYLESAMRDSVRAAVRDAGYTWRDRP